MRMNLEWCEATVYSITDVAEGVRQVEFMLPGAVPPFDPGSHINIKALVNGTNVVRTYTCVPSAQNCLAIAVKLHPNSRGGSRFIWSLCLGDKVQISKPMNRFELSWRAEKYLLIAGGIGVTPIYSMARALVAAGQNLHMIYGGAGRSVMPFVTELVSLLGSSIEIYPADEGKSFDLLKEIAALPENGEAYVCGPLGLLDAVKQSWLASGRPISRLRYEVFGDSGRHLENPFEVSIVNSDLSITVRPDQSLLDALINGGVEMIYDCERGECGLCVVSIVELNAEIDHRDVFFSDIQKRESNKMCACVSRLTGGRAIIDVGYRS